MSGKVNLITGVVEPSNITANLNSLINKFDANVPNVYNTPGLPTMLANGGWQILTDRPFNLSSNSSAALSAVVGSSVTSATVRIAQTALFNSHHIVLVFAGYTGQALPENAGAGWVRFKAALQKAGASSTDETGARVPVTFNGGQQYGYCAPDGIVFSDPIPFDVMLGEIFYTRLAIYTTGPNQPISFGAGLNGGTGAWAVANGDGTILGDVVLQGTTGGASRVGNTFGPVMALGFSQQPQKSVALIGDSIFSGINDGGVYTFWGGYAVRLMRNQTAFITTAANNFAQNSNFAFAHVAEFGGTAATFMNRVNSYKELRLAEFATTIFYQYGINDIGSTSLVNMQANLMTVAAWFIARNKKFIVFTLLPKTTSTDQFQTIANQTVTAQESTRTGYNSWLRLPVGGGGFLDAMNALSIGSGGVMDAAAGIEVDANGNPALNGGFWPAATQTSILTGHITSSPGKTSFTDNTQTFTQDQYRGYMIRMTSGTDSGQVGIIGGHTSGGSYSLASGFTATPSTNDTYTIYQGYTFDGLHPSTLGYQAVANYLNTATNLAQVV